jgi:hypothetical protein
MRRVARRPVLVTLATVAALPVFAVAAGASPLFEGAFGITGAITGDISGGGASVAGAVLWPVPEVWTGTRVSARFGIMGHADDMGSEITELHDPVSGESIGTSETAHRSTWGVSWRLDAMLPAWGSWVPEASGSWGYYRVGDDVRGEDVSSLGSAGFSLGAGIGRPLGALSAAAVVRYHRLFNDRTGRYVTGGVAFRWGRGGR